MDEEIELPSEKTVEFVGRFLMNNPYVESLLLSIEALPSGEIYLTFKNGIGMSAYNEAFFPSKGNSNCTRYYTEDDMHLLLKEYFHEDTCDRF
jgi:hypothetical protein